jgi:hypothetical protein
MSLPFCINKSKTLSQLSMLQEQIADFSSIHVQVTSLAEGFTFPELEGSPLC